MSVLEHVIEFINEAACNKDFDEDNRIGKDNKNGRGYLLLTIESI